VGEEGARPVDVKENGIGGRAADSAPVLRSGTRAAARERGGLRPKGATGWADFPLLKYRISDKEICGWKTPLWNNIANSSKKMCA
jgi:hypothetical protein